MKSLLLSKKIGIILIVLAGLLVGAGNVEGATITSAVTGNWNAATTWAAIARAGTITTSTANVNLTGVGTAFLTELAVGSVVKTSGGVTIGTIASITSNTVATFVANAVSNNTGIAYIAQIVPLSSDNAILATAITVTLTAPASITNLTLNATTSKLVLNASQTLTVSGIYTNGGTTTTNGVNGPGTIFFTGAASFGTLTLTGTRPNVTIGDGTTANTVTIGAATLVADLTVNANATLTNSTFTVGIGGSLSVNGIFNAGTGIYTLTGAAKTIGGTATSVSIPSLTITSPGAYTLGGSTTILTVATALAGNGKWTQAANTILNVGGTSGITALDASTNAGNTVNYTGAAQTVKATTYYNLTLAGSGIKTLGAIATINGTMTVNSGVTLNAGNFSHVFGTGSMATINGIFQTANTAGFSGGASTAISSTNSPLVTLGSASTIEYSATTGSQAVTGITYNNLKLSNTSGTNTANGTVTVNGTLTTTASGIFNMGSNLLSVSMVANAGTLTTQNTSSTPITSGKTWGGTVNYNATTGGQTVVAGTYNNLTFTNTSGTQTAVGALTVNGTLTTTAGGTLNMGTNQLLGTLTAANSGTIRTQNLLNPAITSGDTWAGTVVFDATTGTQSVPAGIYNNLTFSNTSGTQTAVGALTVNGTLTTTAGGTLNMGTNQLLGTLTAANSGTIRTQNLSSPAITSGDTWTGTVVFDATTGTQFVPAGTYNNLTFSNTGGTQTAVGALTVNGTLATTSGGILNMGTNQLLGTLTTVTNGGTIQTQNTTATPIPTGKTWGGTMQYGVTAGGQTVMAGTYNNLTFSNTSGTQTAVGGALTVNGTLTTTAGGTLNMGTNQLLGTLTNVANGGTIQTQNNTATPIPNGKTWGGTMLYNGVAQTIASGTYNNLILSGTLAKTIPAGTSITGNLNIRPGGTGTATASIAAGQNISVGTLSFADVLQVVGTWGYGPANPPLNKNLIYFASTTGYLTVGVGIATQISIYAGNNQSATVSTSVVTAPSVIVKDVYNNPVSGVSVTFAVVIGGGAATGLTATTDVSGIATVGSWTLGSTVGTNNLSATSAGLSGSPLTFTATGTVGALDHFDISTITSPQTVGTAITGITLTAKDANNNTVTSFTGTVDYTGTAGITGTSASFTSGVLSGVSVTPILYGNTRTFIVTGTGKTGTATFDVSTFGNNTSTQFRTKKSGEWGDIATWESSNDGITWVDASITPNSANGTITILNTHTVTVAADVTADQLTVNSGGSIVVNNGISLSIAHGSGVSDMVISNGGNVGVNGFIRLGTGAAISSSATTLFFNSGGTYEHAQNGGTIPTANWDANSTCLITGVTANTPSGGDQTFGNFTWNCTSQTINLYLQSNMTVQGNFTVASTGGADNANHSLRMSGTSVGYTISVGGDFTVQSPATFKMNNAGSACVLNIAGNLNVDGQTTGSTGFYLNTANATNSSAIVNLTGDLNVSSGYLIFSDDGGSYPAILNLIGKFNQTGGEISSTQTTAGYIGTLNFAGTSTQTFTKSSGTIASIINFTINSGAIVDFGTSELDGSTGTFKLSSGAGIITAHQQGLSTTAGTGSIQVTGTKTFDNAANYTYDGTVAQVTGNGLPSTVSNLTFSNAAGVTITSQTDITNNFSISSGSKANLGTFASPNNHTSGSLTLGGEQTVSGSWGSTSSLAANTNDIYFAATSGIINVTTTTCSSPSAPTTTGSSICIGTISTLSASGAINGQKYKWYSAVSGGTTLKTSTDYSDNTYTTPIIGATTSYWVTILNAGGCESSRTQVTATFPAVSPDNQNLSGTNSWIGHVYDGQNFDTYYGTTTETEQFDESFGGDLNCFSISSSLGTRSVYTETFSVKYRMNSSKDGLYVVDLGSDDGNRLTVDGTLIVNDWTDHSFASRPRVLMKLNGASTLVYDFYENGGQNRVVFQNLTLVLANTLSNNTTQNVCIGSTGSAIGGDVFPDLSGTSYSGLSNPGYQWAYSKISSSGPWIDISGATAATYTPSFTVAPFNSATTFYFIRKASVQSANNTGIANPYVATNESNAATVIVNPLLPASVSIAAVPSGAICAGTSVTFTATPTNGGTTPTYQWYNGASLITGATNSTYTSTALTNGNSITVQMTSNATCATGSPATSSAIVMTVNPLLPASVSIAASATTICAGTSVTFTATPTNGGTTPTYQWYNGASLITGATSSIYTSTALTNGNSITVQMTSNAPCATGNPATSSAIVMTVNPLLPASVSIAAVPSGAICAGTSVTFTATPTNGGTTPTYQWYNGASLITGATNSTYTSTALTNGNSITVQMTSNATCVIGNPATSNAVTMTVYSQIGNNTLDNINGNHGVICGTAAENANVVMTAPAGTIFTNVGFASYGTPNGTCPSFTIGTCHALTSQSITEQYVLGNNSANIPATNTVFTDPCVGTLKRLFVVATYTEPICAGNTSGTITGAIPTGGNGTFIYSWESSTTSSSIGFVPATGTNNQQDYTPGIMSQTTWYRRTVTSGGCSDVSKVIMIKVTPVLAGNTISSDQSICTGLTPSTLAGSIPTGGDGAFTYLWEMSTTGSISGFSIASGTSNSQNYTPSALTQTTWFRRTVTSGGCNNTTAAVQITVNPLPNTGSIVPD